MEQIKISVALPKEQKERFELVCMLRRLNMGDILRDAVELFLKKHEKDTIEKFIAKRTGGAA